jgi:hypothetical protein
MFNRRKRWKRALLAKMALGFAVAAALAPAAQGFRTLDDRTVVPRTETGAVSHDTTQALQALGQRWQAEAAFYQRLSNSSPYPRPDDRAGIHSVDGIMLGDANGKVWGIAPTSIVANEPAGPVRMTSQRRHSQAPFDRHVSTSGGGFDLTDALIGAVCALGAALAAAGAFRMTRTSRRPRPRPV